MDISLGLRAAFPLFLSFPTSLRGSFYFPNLLLLKVLPSSLLQIFTLLFVPHFLLIFVLQIILFILCQDSLLLLLLILL